MKSPGDTNLEARPTQFHPRAKIRSRSSARIASEVYRSRGIVRAPG
jgi:hypothetical protein